MSNIFDKKINKEKCQKFTPPEMVETMLDLIKKYYGLNVKNKNLSKKFE